MSAVVKLAAGLQDWPQKIIAEPLKRDVLESCNARASSLGGETKVSVGYDQ